MEHVLIARAIQATNLQVAIKQWNGEIKSTRNTYHNKTIKINTFIQLLNIYQHGNVTLEK